jgi:predicted Fe-S protein YdhL (DUF1289 family)
MQAVVSPCVKICQLNAQRVCVGCGRTADEIAEWLAASDARRAAIRQAASARLAQRPLSKVHGVV